MGTSEIQRWFENHVSINGEPYRLDDEQAAVISDTHKNAIVTARAGSGKTHTLIAKIIYLIAIKNVNPTHILALGFNASPQEDFRKRLCAVRVDNKQIIDRKASENIARTFHSFACDIAALPEGEILFDNNKKREKHARTKYINAITEKIVSGKAIYDFIRNSSYEPKREDYETDKEYYAATKYQNYDTLGGEIVRSHGEKIIADFLFEHGIEYEYERGYYPKSLKQYAINDKYDENIDRLAEHEKILSDFYLVDYNYVWEHWGITGKENEHEIERINESGAIGKYEEYDEKKEFKEWFYEKEWLDGEKVKRIEHNAALDRFLEIQNCIYTNYERGKTREEFEAIIKEKLESLGIECVKLPEEILIKKFSQTNNIEKTSDRIKTFIERAGKQFPNDFSGLERACQKETEEQTKLFYKAALAAYHFYLSEIQPSSTKHKQKRLIDKLYPDTIYNDDYDLLMSRTAAAITNHQERAEAKIKIDSLEYIFLDEYQDFSLLFYNLVSAIAKRVQDIHILAVGDDWQAINGYTGASLEYFENFEKYFPEDTARLQIRTNYRSVCSIVEAANRFMFNSLNDDNKAIANQEDSDSCILNDCVLDDIRKFYPDEDHETAHDYQRRYDLLLTEIVKENHGKSIKFLNRTKDLRFEKNDYENITEFEKAFKLNIEKRLKTPTDNISFSTVHTAKGLEADVIVLLESDTGRFPIFHPDNHLYKVFGENEQKALDEQKRLFYVAITRPKEKLYIVHNYDKTEKENERDKEETNKKSDRDFLDLLEINRFNKYEKDSFIALQKLLELKKVKKFRVKKIEAKKSKQDPDHVDFTLTALDNQKVFRNNAFKNDESAKQLFDMMSWCNKDNPATIYAHVDDRYSKKYVKFYNATKQW